MSLLTSIDGIPLFTTRQEALDWADGKGLTGVHTHNYRGVTGYMGGANHVNAVTGRPIGTVPNPPTRSSGGGGY